MNHEARLERLEARAAIEEVMQFYAAASDAKYAADCVRKDDAEVAVAARQQAACFTEDGEWDGGHFGGRLIGRDAITRFFMHGPWRFTSHHYGSPRILVEGDSASVSWRLLEIGVSDTEGQVQLLTGSVRQAWRRVQGEWKISRMAFERLYAVALNTDPAALRCLIDVTGEAS